MKESIVIALAALVVSLGVVAFAPGMAAAIVKTGYIGDTLRLRGSDMTYTTADVTVIKMRRVAEEHLLGLRLKLRNVRTQYNKYNDWQQTITAGVRIWDSTGKRLRVSRSATDERIYNIHLDLGQSAAGWLYFTAQPKQNAKTFQFKVDGNLGYDTGRWSLR
jgi:hypothetical protein